MNCSLSPCIIIFVVLAHDNVIESELERMLQLTVRDDSRKSFTPLRVGHAALSYRIAGTGERHLIF